MGLSVPIEMEALASDKRASIAAHSIALLLHEALESGIEPDPQALFQWRQRWHHAVMRIRDHGPDPTTGAGIVTTSH